MVIRIARGVCTALSSALMSRHREINTCFAGAERSLFVMHPAACLPDVIMPYTTEFELNPNTPAAVAACHTLLVHFCIEVPWSQECKAAVLKSDLNTLVQDAYTIAYRTEQQHTKRQTQVLRVYGSVPKGNNELIGPQQAKEVVDEEVFQLLVPHCGVVAGGVIGTCSIGQVCGPCRGWGRGWGGWGWGTP